MMTDDRFAQRTTGALGSSSGHWIVITIVAITATAATWGVAARPADPSPGLTGGAQVARAYDAVMDAEFGVIPGLLADTCPPAPAQACQLLATVSTWWQIQIDPHNRSRDAAFQKQVDSVIAAIEQWTAREPARAEAWFYLGGAYGARAQWRVLRGQTLAAARDGKRIKTALERSLMLDPALHDAYFGIGLYHYYAAVAPAAARMLRWLMLLPGGDREQGLREMLRARTDGQLLRSEADYQLHLIYVWYEKNPLRALELLSGLSQRHPRNPHFLQQIADVEDMYVEDHAASLRAWQALLERARERRVAFADLAVARAELGVALELVHTGEPEAAIPHLRGVIESRPSAPVGAEALAQLQLGYVYDRLDRRDQAIAAYRAALAVNPAGDPLKIDARARAGVRVPNK
jgi:tetratricopeptide (TPR) repeat protein